MRISDWSSDVCSSDLVREQPVQHRIFRKLYRADDAGPRRAAPLRPWHHRRPPPLRRARQPEVLTMAETAHSGERRPLPSSLIGALEERFGDRFQRGEAVLGQHGSSRSEEHTSEIQSLIRISYADFCLKKKNTKNQYELTH